MAALTSSNAGGRQEKGRAVGALYKPYSVEDDSICVFVHIHVYEAARASGGAGFGTSAWYSIMMPDHTPGLYPDTLLRGPALGP